MASNRTPTTFYGPAYLVTTPATLYTVPANKIAVVKMVDFFGNNADTGSLAIDSLGDTEDIAYSDSVIQDQNKIGWTYLVLTGGQLLIGATYNGDTNLVATITGDLYDV